MDESELESPDVESDESSSVAEEEYPPRPASVLVVAGTGTGTEVAGETGGTSD